MPLYMPQMYKKETSRSMTANFYGLNHNLKIADGEWYDMENLTSDHLPVAAVRGKRKRLSFISPTITERIDNPLGFIAAHLGEDGKQTPVWINANGIMSIGGTKIIDLIPYGLSTITQKRIVEMGAYLIIIPDWIWVNTAKDFEIGNVQRSMTWPLQGTEEPADGTWLLNITVCDYDGEYPTFSQAQEPTKDQDIKNGDTWHKTGEGTELRRYDDESESWEKTSSYVRFQIKIKQTGSTITLADAFFDRKIDIRTGDVLDVQLSNTPGELLKILSKPLFVAGVAKKNVIGSDGEISSETDAFWTSGILSEASGLSINLSESQKLTIRSHIPEVNLNTVITSGNRLWAAAWRRDTTGAEETVYNEIYASARGDFSRWIIGSADDEDAAVTFSIGDGGEWTGAIEYRGYPTFFKEDRIFQIAGSSTSDFSVDKKICDGVDLYASASLQEVSGQLYYKSAHSIMQYDGSYPVSVSDMLGTRVRPFARSQAGKVGGKYYVSGVTDIGDVESILATVYVFDTKKGVWTKESTYGIDALYGKMASSQNVLYVLNRSTLYAIGPVESTAAHWDKKKEHVEWRDEEWNTTWYAESGIIGLETPDEKYITRLAIRLKLEAGAHVRVLIQYDSSGEWEQVMAAEFVGMRTVTVPVHPHKYDHMRYRLEGEGDCQIFSVTKTLERAGRR